MTFRIFKIHLRSKHYVSENMTIWYPNRKYNNGYYHTYGKWITGNNNCNTTARPNRSW